MTATRLEVDVRRSGYSPEPDCAIAQSLGAIGDDWQVMIVRDLARGLDLLADTGSISRTVLAERLAGLVESGVVEREPYQDRPPRFAYRLTARGRALPVLVAHRDWGDRWRLGGGAPSGTNGADDRPALWGVAWAYRTAKDPA